MRRCERGFTLIEVLVVMVIIAILVTIVGLSMKGDRAGEALEVEAKRLTALLNLLREEAVLRHETLGLALSIDGYLFVIQAPTDLVSADEPLTFRPLSDDETFRPRVLPPGIHLTFETRSSTLSLPVRRGTHTPVLLALPQDLLVPEGRLVLSHAATARSVRLEIDMDGARLEPSHGRR